MEAFEHFLDGNPHRRGPYQEGEMKKYAAPIIILVILSVLAVLWGFLYFTIFSNLNFPPMMRFVVIIAAAVSIGLLTAAFIQRIKEINRGEDDDISKY